MSKETLRVHRRLFVSSYSVTLVAQYSNVFIQDWEEQNHNFEQCTKCVYAVYSPIMLKQQGCNASAEEGLQRHMTNRGGNKGVLGHGKLKLYSAWLQPQLMPPGS